MYIFVNMCTSVKSGVIAVKWNPFSGVQLRHVTLFKYVLRTFMLAHLVYVNVYIYTYIYIRIDVCVCICIYKCVCMIYCQDVCLTYTHLFCMSHAPAH